MGQICCHETSLRNYHYLLHNSLEKRSSHLLTKYVPVQYATPYAHPTNSKRNLEVTHIKHDRVHIHYYTLRNLKVRITSVRQNENGN